MRCLTVTKVKGLVFDEDGNIIRHEQSKRSRKKKKIRKYKYRVSNKDKFIRKLRDKKSKRWRKKFLELEEKFDNVTSSSDLSPWKIERAVQIAEEYIGLYKDLKIEEDK